MGSQNSRDPLEGTRPDPEREVFVLFLGTSIGPEDVGGLWRRVEELAPPADSLLIVCDVGALEDPDVAALEALARLQLRARRCGNEVRLRSATPQLRDLLGFTGFERCLPSYEKEPGSEALRVELRRQAEEREEALGVQKERNAVYGPVLDVEHLYRPRLEASVRAWLVLAKGGHAVGNGRHQT